MNHLELKSWELEVAPLAHGAGEALKALLVLVLLAVASGRCRANGLDWSLEAVAEKICRLFSWTFKFCRSKKSAAWDTKCIYWEIVINRSALSFCHHYRFPFGCKLTSVLIVKTSLKSFVVLMSRLFRSSTIVVECSLLCFVRFAASFRESQRTCKSEMAAFSAVISCLMTEVRSCISTAGSSNIDVLFATAI